MKLIFIILDGMADDPNGTLLGECSTPNLDEMCRNGSMGMVNVLPGATHMPQSHEAILSLLGLDTSRNYPERGPLEALGARCITKDEGNYLAMRANFAALENEDSVWDARVIDSRAGRTLTSKEASVLGDALQEIEAGCDFMFKPTVEHRASLVLRGNFSRASDTDPAYSAGKKKPRKSGITELDSFIEQAYGMLSSHEINARRIRKGLLPANAVLTREAGSKLPDMKSIMDAYGMKWCAILGMPLEIGIADVCGMSLRALEQPEINEQSVKDLYSLHFHPSLEKTSQSAAKMLEKNLDVFDAFWVHLKEFDIPGHDGRRNDKKKMVEAVDRNFFSVAKDLDAVAIVTSDHATPCGMKSHSNDSVPLLVSGIKDGKDNSFSEKGFMKGALGTMKGPDLLRTVMGMRR